MSNPTLTQIELPSGSIYDLVDQGARDLIAAINQWEYLVCTNAANTPYGVTWESGGTTITGTLVASDATMYIIYLVPTSGGVGSDGYKEYITVKTGASTPYVYSWEMLGTIVAPDLTNYIQHKNSSYYGQNAGALAYKDSASGSVTVPKTYTSSTTVSTATTESKSVSVSGTTAGSVSETKATVTVSKASTGTATYTPAGTNAASSVSGSCTVTPSGTISIGTGTANYTPAGSIAVSTAGSTTTIKNPTSKTVVTDMSVAAPSSTAATGELVYCEVSGTKLTLKKFVETTGASISTSNVTVKNGDAAYSFSGTGTQLKFTGSASSGTVSGTAEAQAFTGTGARLVTDSQVLTGASFSGANMTATGSVDVPKTYSATTTTATNTTESKTVTVS